eukprot:COSAG03_NODE_1318_length_4338_cov_5.485492_3_plen_88_part_00
MMKKDQRFIDDPSIGSLTAKQLKVHLLRQCSLPSSLAHAALTRPRVEQVAKDWHARFVKKYTKVGSLIGSAQGSAAPARTEPSRPKL